MCTLAAWMTRLRHAAIALVLLGACDRACGGSGVDEVSARLLCIVEDAPPSSETSTSPDEGGHVHLKRLAIPLNDVANRCPTKGHLRVVVTTPDGSELVNVSARFAGRGVAGRVRRGAQIALPSAISLEGTKPGTYDVDVRVGPREVKVPKVVVYE